MASYRSCGIFAKTLILTLCILSRLAADPLPTPIAITSQQLANVPWWKGHFEITTYLYVTFNTGTYNKHWHTHKLRHKFCNINPQIFCLFEITKWMDFQMIPQLLYNITQGKSSIHFGDLPLGFDFQLYPDDASPCFPGVKLTLREIFPTGKYQKLRPRKKSTDLSGQGSFQTTAALEFYKVYHLKRHRSLSNTLYFSYTYLAPVHVKGFSAYGGGYHTNGKVRPGNILQGIISFEYTLNRNWAFCIDNIYIHTNNDHFSGRRGFKDEKVAKVGGPSSEQISFAPTMKYKFSRGFSLNVGAWVSAWGRNSTEFRGFLINFDYKY